MHSPNICSPVKKNHPASQYRPPVQDICISQHKRYPLHRQSLHTRQLQVTIEGFSARTDIASAYEGYTQRNIKDTPSYRHSLPRSGRCKSTSKVSPHMRSLPTPRTYATQRQGFPSHTFWSQNGGTNHPWNIKISKITYKQYDIHNISAREFNLDNE